MHTQTSRPDWAIYTRDHQWELPLINPEEIAGFGTAVDEGLLEVIFETHIAHLADNRVSMTSKKEIIEWICDPLFRPDQEVPALSFRGYCKGIGIETFSMIALLSQRFRHLIDEIFGVGAASKIYEAADDRIPDAFMEVH
jgi:hypothetical protein